tara:strand:- start:347 stop:1279 length:933 start_codon:yes stop_codon:yes gene_type:complete
LRNLVTGGAGFIGSNLVEKLIKNGEYVICLDNFSSSSKINIKDWLNNPKFKLIEHDIIDPIEIEIDRIWHLASPASPLHYQANPIKTSKTLFLGTYNMLELANRVGARLLMASSSEIYGNPEISPQTENYTGSVNTIGVRSCYDEGKRIAETLCFDYNRKNSVEVRIARIFNTYGPKMLPNDGRVISNFITQSLEKKPLTIYGNGSQTRSFCYISDLINGLIKLMNSDFIGPVNLGNPQEISIKKLAGIIKSKIDNQLEFSYKSLPQDDPLMRLPSIEIAKKYLKWEPYIEINEGLTKTINYMKEVKNEF